MSASLTIYTHALKDKGLKETPGGKSTPRIAYAIQTAAPWLDRDDSATPWCGCIRGLWGLETGTGVPKEHFRAKEWLKWGKPVDIAEAQKGDTVILKRSGGHHVALFDHMEGSAVFLLGGNQGNAVNVSAYKRGDVVGIRRS